MTEQQLAKESWVKRKVSQVETEIRTILYGMFLPQREIDRIAIKAAQVVRKECLKGARKLKLD